MLSTIAAQQATPYPLAHWRARFLLERSGNHTSLTELGCGLGADTVALSQLFEVTAYEQDPARAILARANLAELGQDGSEVRAGALDPGEVQAELLYCDPARRQDKREFDPEDWSPPLSVLLEARESGRVRFLALKCAPGLKVVPAGAEVHFLSLGGELKEAFLWFDRRSPGERRTAWVLSKEWKCWRSCGNPPGVGPPIAGEFLHNPDPAILRAHALDSLGHELGARLLHPKIGYLCGPTPCPGPGATSFEILEVLKLNWKTLGSALIAQGWREYEYLGRGVPFSQPEVHRRLERASKRMKKKGGQGRGTVIVYRAEGDYVALLCQRRE